MTPSRSWTSTLLLGAVCVALVPTRPKQCDAASVPVALCSRSAVCKTQLKQATELYQAKRYAEALLAFQGVYARWPEARLLLNIGRTLQKLGHLKEALDYFKRCQEKNLGDADAQAALQRYIDEVQAQQAQAQLPPAAAETGTPKAAPEMPAPDPKDGLVPAQDGVAVVSALSAKPSPTAAPGSPPEAPSERAAPDPSPSQRELPVPPLPPATRAAVPPVNIVPSPPESVTPRSSLALRKEGTPVYRKWWFWTLIGVGAAGVAGAAAGIAVATRSSPSVPEAPPLPPNLESYYPMY